MIRIWFNRTFSNVRTVFDLIREGDTSGEFHLLCSHSQPGFPGFCAAHEWLLEPTGLDDDAYLEFCLEVCRQHQIDGFWPGKGIQLLAAHQECFAEQGVQLLIPAQTEPLAVLMDKARFYAQTQLLSIPPPVYLECRRAADFEAAYAQLRASHDVLCIKPAVGVNGAGFRVIDEQRSGLEILLQNALYAIPLATLRHLLSEAGRFDTLLLMEFLGGAEYSVDCVGDGQRLIAAVQRQKPLPGAYGQQIVEIPAITQTLDELIAAFGLRGLFNVQFREGRHGLRLLEINPRFSGGIGYAGAIGINLPYLALHGLIHGFSDQRPDIKTGLRVLEQTCYLQTGAAC